MGEAAFTKPAVALEELADFLTGHHGGPISDLEILKGGFWSRAYAYRASGRELVLRLGTDRNWFETDRAACRFASNDLPIPEVLTVGEALGRVYAISERRRGSFLELAPPESADAVGAAVVRLLRGLRAHAEPGASTQWFTGAPGTWHEWLRYGLQDNPGHHTHGWRDRLTDVPAADAVFGAACDRIEGLLPLVPERRDLVHSDLLHGNVLMSPDWSAVTAIFSWKCSARGDFLYDVAWCSTWSEWFPGIQAAAIFDRVLASGGFDGDLKHGDARHLCYQLQIAASHMGWYIWTEDCDNLTRVTRVLAEILGAA